MFKKSAMPRSVFRIGFFKTVRVPFLCTRNLFRFGMVEDFPTVIAAAGGSAGRGSPGPGDGSFVTNLFRFGKGSPEAKNFLGNADNGILLFLFPIGAENARQTGPNPFFRLPKRTPRSLLSPSRPISAAR